MQEHIASNLTIYCRIEISEYPGFGPDPNWAMIRPNRAHTPVFPDRNYRVWKAIRAHNSLDHGLILVWSEVNSVWTVWS